MYKFVQHSLYALRV